MRYVSLFTGIGGLDRAIDALGGECLVQVEREPYCLSVLGLRYPDVPKVTDVHAFVGSHGVDLVIGGPPCQPVSHAGRRKGADDERWLWGQALRVVGESRPERVFFENPMGLRTMGLDTVLDGLTELGYGGAWEVVAAADVGAPHLRKRIFIMGVRGRAGWDGPTRPKGNQKVTWPTPLVGDMHLSSTPEAARRRIAEGKVTLSRAVQSGLWPDRMAEHEAAFGDEHDENCPLCGVDAQQPDNRGVTWPTPTPTASGERPNEGNVRLLRARVLAGDMTEAEAAGMLNGKSVFEAQGKVPAMPTPSHADGTGGPGTSPKREGGLNLRTYVSQWPTPTSRDYKDSGDSIANGTVPINGLLGRAVGPTRATGALNPDWVEWLMNLPIGHTDITRTELGPVWDWEYEPAIPRIGLGIPNRSKRLTALGNAVVPAQAIFAWQRLSQRLGL